jgi:hypothetical protein
MLRVRKEQIDILAEAALEAYEDDMLAHVEKFFPNHVRVAGEPVIRAVIRFGMKRAAAYGFDTDRNVSLYITTMFMLGSRFDEDVMYPWAQEILTDPADPDPYSRAERTADKALAFLNTVAGRGDRTLYRVFLNLEKNYPKIMSELPPGDFAQGMSDRLCGVFAKKREALGEQIIRLLIEQGIQDAAAYGISGRRGQVIYIVLMFLMGSPFDRDPLLPWAAEILTDAAPEGEQEKIDRLFDASHAYLGRWLKSLGHSSH